MFVFINRMFEKIKSYFSKSFSFDEKMDKTDDDFKDGDLLDTVADNDTSVVMCEAISQEEKGVSLEDSDTPVVTCEVISQEEKNVSLVNSNFSNDGEVIVKHKLPDWLANMKFGTVIYANRFQTKEDALKICKGHERGPYIVVGYTDDSLVCLYGTSVVPKEYVFSQHFILEANKEEEFALTKDTYFDVNYLKFLDDSRGISEMGILDDDDLERLAKMLSVKKMHRRNDRYFNSKNLMIPEITLDCGCIFIRNNKRYFIFNKTDDSLDTFLVTLLKEDNQEGDILINKRYYKLDFDTQKSFPTSKSNFVICDLVSKKQYYTILQKMKKHFDDAKKEKTEIRRGSVIDYQNNYYYVYSEEGNSIMAFLISKKDDEEKSSIQIKKEDFYTTFDEEITLLKKEASNYDIIMNATEQEMNEIKKRKKEYKKIQKEKNAKKSTKKKSGPNFPYIIAGVVIETNTLARDRYLVLNRENNNANYVDGISVDNIFNGDKSVETVVLARVKKVGEIPEDSLQKIKSWLDEDKQVSEDIKVKFKQM